MSRETPELKCFIFLLISSFCSPLINQLLAYLTTLGIYRKEAGEKKKKMMMKEEKKKKKKP